MVVLIIGLKFAVWIVKKLLTYPTLQSDSIEKVTTQKCYYFLKHVFSMGPNDKILHGKLKHKHFFGSWFVRTLGLTYMKGLSSIYQSRLVAPFALELYIGTKR